MDTAVTSHDFASAPINKALTPDDKLRFLKEMLRIRRFEQAALKHYNAGKMGGFLHLYIGQESVAVGAVSLMGPNDHVITAYRDHGHALAVGMSMNECMAELFGKATGCSKGKGGSMHFFAPDKNYWGGHGIVGGQTPLGLGLAYAIKSKGLAGACLSYMGMRACFAKGNETPPRALERAAPAGLAHASAGPGSAPNPRFCAAA